MNSQILLEGSYAVKNGLVFTENGVFQKLDVRVKGEKIAEVGRNLEAGTDEVKDLNGKWLLLALLTSTPTAVAEQTSVTEPRSSADDGRYLSESRRHNHFGTSTTLQPDTLRRSSAIMGNFPKNRITAPRMIGVNMEGPFLSMKKRGAHIPEYLLPADFDLFCELNELSGGRIRQVDLAPKSKTAWILSQRHLKSAPFVSPLPQAVMSKPWQPMKRALPAIPICTMPW